MKLRKNDYIRTNKRIFKIEDINDYDICVLDTFCELFYSHTTGTTAFFMSDKDEPYTIIKSSPNIIDLIEVGDVITTNNLCGEITKIDGDKIYTTCYDGEYCSASDIKTIVTHEQFKSMEFEVK